MNSNDLGPKKNDEPTTKDTVLGLGIIVAVGFFVYWLFFGGDRAEITRCIEVAAESDGGRFMPSTYRRMQADVDRADEVTIIEKTTVPFASIDLKIIRFTVDGREQSIRCRT